MALWHTGARTPGFKMCFKRILKCQKITKIWRVHLDIIYAHKVLREKPTSYVSRVEKTNSVLKSAFRKTSFCLFIEAIKNISFL